MRPRKQKTRVTIIVGIIAKEMIVVACDSQTTSGTSKRHDMGKITLVHGNNNESKLLVAQSGHADFSSRVVEIFEEKIRNVSLDDYRSAADVLQVAIAQLKAEIRQQYENMSPESLLAFCENHAFSLLLAYHHKNQPCMFTVDFENGICVKRRTYITLGCGGSVAEFILSSFDTANICREDACTLALYVVNEAKRVDAFCGGPTWLAWLSERGAFLHCEATDKSLASAIRGIYDHDTGVKSAWLKQASEKITEALKQGGHFRGSSESSPS